MTRRPSLDDSPSLFPFLAVLICTVGALVVLLVIMIRQSRVEGESQAEAARAQAEQARAAAAEAARVAAEDWQWKADVLEQSRQQQAEDLAKKRNELSHLEDHTRQVEQEADQLVRALETLKKNHGEHSVTVAQIQTQLAALREKLAESKTKLDAAREQVKHRKRSYSIVPYDGPNGTHRRPIYIECLADRVILQPTGVTLLNPDFEPPLGTDNPLASALRATREFWSQSAADGAEPYPLLIVRPDGEEAYAAARHALCAWETEFGYELVPTDMQLAYPVADTRLAELQQRVVEESRERRLAMQRAIPNSRARAFGLRASPNGGFVAISADEAPRSRDRIPDGAGTGYGRRNGRAANRQNVTRNVSQSGVPQGGYGDGPGGNGPNTPEGNGNAMSRFGNGNGLGDGGTGTGTFRPGQGNGAPSYGNRGQGPAGAASGPSTGTGSGTGNALYDEGAGGAGNDRNGSDATGASSATGGEGDGAAAGTRSGKPGSGATGTGGSGSGGSGSGGSGSGGSGSGGSGSDDSGTGGEGDGQGGPAGEGPELYAASGQGAGAGNRGQGTPGGPGGPGGSPSSSGSPGSNAGQPGAAGGQNGGGPSGGGASGRMGGSAGMGMGQAGMSGPAGMAMGANADPSNPGGMPNMGLSAVYDPMPTGQAMKLRKGGQKNWGLPNKSGGAIPIARPLRARVNSNRLELLPDKRSKAPGQEFDVSKGMEPVLEPFVAGIWRQMKAWGIAGSGVYWKPTLHVEVAPGADAMYEQLEQTLHGSGIAIKKVMP